MMFDVRWLMVDVMDPMILKQNSHLFLLLRALFFSINSQQSFAQNQQR
jgi:hypothetical protein